MIAPLLILLFGVHPATAVGTDLLYAAATKSAGTLVHGLNRSIDWRLVGRLAAGSLPTTALALFALSRFGTQSGAAQAVVTGVLGAPLTATTLVLVFRKRMLAVSGAVVEELDPWCTTVLTVLLGAVLAYWYRSPRSGPEC